MKRKKKQHFNWNILIIDTIIFSMFVGLIWASFWWSGFKNSLAVNKIKFGETSILNESVYNSTLGEIEGIHPYNIDIKNISELLEDHPYVKAARVSHRYPGTIQIEIEEREPIALLKSDPMIMLDQDGYVLPDLNNLQNFNLPILTNFNPDLELYPIGKKALSVKVNECIISLAWIKQDYEQLFDNLSELKISENNEIELILADQPTQIFLGENELGSRIKILKQFEVELGTKKISDFSYLDMRYKNQIIVKGRRS